MWCIWQQQCRSALMTVTHNGETWSYMTVLYFIGTLIECFILCPRTVYTVLFLETKRCRYVCIILVSRPYILNWFSTNLPADDKGAGMPYKKKHLSVQNFLSVLGRAVDLMFEYKEPERPCWRAAAITSLVRMEMSGLVTWWLVSKHTIVRRLLVMLDWSVLPAASWSSCCCCCWPNQRQQSQIWVKRLQM